MCSIMGYCSCDVTYDDFKAAFERTKSRGPDDTRVIFAGKGLLGFHRLAIMGLHPEGMQPFELDGSAVVCNGEIYGFERIKQILQQKGYSFQRQSDFEILLPLYKEYGTAMFRMLDAEFALILYDAEEQAFVAPATPSASGHSITDTMKRVLSSLPAKQKTLWGSAVKSCPSRPDITTRMASSSATGMRQR